MTTSKPSLTPTDLACAPSTLPDGPNVAPSPHEHEAAQDGIEVDAGRAGDREKRIRAAAHALAARRGFAPGHELDDWLQAEREMDAGGDSQP